MSETVPIKKTVSLFDELNLMRERIMQRAFEIFDSNGQVFGRDLDDWLQAERELTWNPSIELEEKDNEFRLLIGVPGVDPKDIDIEVTAEDILVKAEVRHEHEEKKGKVHVCEFASGNFFRTIHLPKRIDPDKVKAEFKSGMLTLKAEIAEEVQAKNISVGVA